MRNITSIKAALGLLPCAGLLTVLQGFSVPAFSQTPAGWHDTQDMSKACQISLPPTWTVTPDGQGTAPDGGQAVVVIGSARPVTPLTPDDQKLLQVDRLIENSAKRVFYVSKPQGDQLQYIVDQQFNAKRCQLQLIVPKAYPEAEVLKIASTLRSTH